ncbi:MAG: two-component system, NarL family, response regulator DevR [Actinomycetota bacterium]|jgi:DNA-binding NarL/FixJ family response regulator|nr:two-component system, NarL family, response regulator DevR [Actinomycetota bacterium]
MAGAPNRTLIVDDDEDMRFLLRAVIERANEGLEVAAEAGGALEALEQWRAVRPDVIVLDHRMPGTTGLQVAAQILAETPEQSIILFSAYLDDDLVARASALGIRACISKDRYDDIPEALWRYGPAA